MGIRLKDPKPFQYDYDGACIPGGMGKYEPVTFSVGVFQWIPTKDGKDVKRSAVIKRFKGYSNDPQKVYDKAEEHCKQLELKQTSHCEKND